MLEAVLFDMDGLLVDSENVWFQARRDLFADHGRPWTDADQRPLAGASTATWVDAMFDKLGGALPRDRVEEEIVSRMEARYASGDVPVLAGAQQALVACAERYRLALASGSPMRLIRAALDGTGWGARFEHVVSSDEVEHGKPAPDVYLEACRRLGVAPERSAVIEDSAAGIRAGLAAGSFVVAVPNPHTDPGPDVLALAHATIPTLADLADCLATLGRRAPGAPT